MKPKRAIRRFDVFAEYRKQEETAAGRPEDEAKGYGLWVAKVVGAKPPERRDLGEPGERREPAAPPLVAGKWHTLDGEPQTDDLFDREIVQRMGQDFYREVFAPAIRAAREQRRPYESIRDSIRKDWKPD
jgi:hypothetical protein